MWPSLKPSQRVGVVAAIDPQSAGAPVSTGWIDMALFIQLMAVVQAGAIGAAATVDARFDQAQDAQGTGVKPVAANALATLTETPNDQSASQSIMNLSASMLDVNNNFRFVRLVVTPAVANSLIAALVLGVDPHNGFASDYDAPSVAQITGIIG